MAYYFTHGISQFLLNNKKQMVRFLLPTLYIMDILVFVLLMWLNSSITHCLIIDWTALLVFAGQMHCMR